MCYSLRELQWHHQLFLSFLREWLLPAGHSLPRCLPHHLLPQYQCLFELCVSLPDLFLYLDLSLMHQQHLPLGQQLCGQLREWPHHFQQYYLPLLQHGLPHLPLCQLFSLHILLLGHLSRCQLS
jgi:hypothetical protein